MSWEGTTLHELRTAQAVIAAQVSPTPCMPCAFGNDLELFIKREDLVETGSFKIRGAAFCLNMALGVARTFVTASTGNFGAALALLSGRLGLRSHVFVPEGTADAKKRRLLQYGATVREYGASLDDSTAHARRHAVENGWRFIEQTGSATIVGLSSLGLELWAQAPDVEVVFLPLGLGASAAGVTLARNALRVPATLVGIVPENCAAWAKSWLGGHPERSEPGGTLADALRTALPSARLFKFLRANLSGVVSVSEVQIEAAQRSLSLAIGSNIEGASATALAAALTPTGRDIARGRKVGLAICGRHDGVP
jgi:threonine dehydratase